MKVSITFTKPDKLPVSMRVEGTLEEFAKMYDQFSEGEAKWPIYDLRVALRDALAKANTVFIGDSVQK